MPDQAPLETAEGAATAALAKLVDGSAGTMIPTGHYPEELAEIAFAAAAPVLRTELTAAEQRGQEQVATQAIEAIDARVAELRDRTDGRHSDDYINGLEAAADLIDRATLTPADDESAADVLAAFEAGEKGVTARPLPRGQTAYAEFTPTPSACTSCDDTGSCAVCRDGGTAEAGQQCSACSNTYRCGQCSAPTPAGGEAGDSCPHCDPRHESPARCSWGVRIGLDRDGDGQPTYLIVQPSNGAHVAQADVDWLWNLIRDWRPAPAPPAEEPAPADTMSSVCSMLGMVDPRAFEGQTGIVSVLGPPPEPASISLDTLREAFLKVRDMDEPPPAPTSGKGETL